MSFLSHGASGIFGYASKVAAAAGQGIASISLDNEFRDWHNDKVVVAATNLNREWKRRGVQNVGYIVTKPIADIVLGFAGGITGVVVSPIKGFRRSGITGFIVGIGAGFIGIFAKPLVSDHVAYFPFLCCENGSLIYYPTPSGRTVRCSNTLFCLYS